MLQTTAVHPTTLAILKKIMQMPDFQQFNLVGGTALALQIGHRVSIDLDLFTYREYDDQKILHALQKIGEVELLVNNPPFFQVNLDNVKVDFLKFPYAFVQDYTDIDGVRLISIEDIAVMKLLAIARRGVKKDFYDLYFILERYDIAALVEIFKSKLPKIDMFHIFKSLTYFDDAEPDADPKMLIKVTWPTVKKTIIQKTNAYLRGAG